MFKFGQSPEITSAVKSVLREPSVLHFWEKAPDTGFVLPFSPFLPSGQVQGFPTGALSESWKPPAPPRLFSLPHPPRGRFLAALLSALPSATRRGLCPFYPRAWGQFCFRAARRFWEGSQRRCRGRIKAAAAAQRHMGPARAAGLPTGDGAGLSFAPGTVSGGGTERNSFARRRSGEQRAFQMWRQRSTAGGTPEPAPSHLTWQTLQAQPRADLTFSCSFYLESWKFSWILSR